VILSVKPVKKEELREDAEFQFFPMF